MADLVYELLDADQAYALAGEVQDLYAEVYGEWMVRKPYRGRGVGGRLLRMLLDGRPEPYAILASNPAAPARSIYARMGWRQCGTIAPKLIPPMDILVLPLPGPR